MFFPVEMTILQYAHNDQVAHTSKSSFCQLYIFKCQKVLFKSNVAFGELEHSMHAKPQYIILVEEKIEIRFWCTWNLYILEISKQI